MGIDVSIQYENAGYRHIIDIPYDINAYRSIDQHAFWDTVFGPDIVYEGLYIPLEEMAIKVLNAMKYTINNLGENYKVHAQLATLYCQICELQSDNELARLMEFVFS